MDGVHARRLRGGGTPDGPRTWGDDDDEVHVAPPVRPMTCLQRELGAERPPPAVSLLPASWVAGR